MKNKLIDCIGIENVKLEEPMEKHTTFRIEHWQIIFMSADSGRIKSSNTCLCKRQGHRILFWEMEAILVSDKGYHGAVIQIWKNMSEVSVEDETKIRAQAGAQLSKIASCALEQSLEGFEFAAGIPGTLGGAVVMNAGAYGGELKDVLVEATVLDTEGNVRTLKNEELELGYRHSIVKEKNYIVLEAVIELKKGSADSIKAVMDDLKEKRVSKQPLDRPSAGSTFKRPEGHFAGKLIMDAGLRGFQVGGAQVSEKHCGFVVNAGGATAEDVLNLVKAVQKKVQDEFGILLETEIKFLGEF